jgi:hypothetical protein
VREQTGGRGVDVVLDMVGGAYFTRNIEVLATEGRLVEIATLHGAKAELNIQTIMKRRLTITGSTLRARPIADKGVIAAAVHQHVWPLLESGAVKPDVSAARRGGGASGDGGKHPYRQARARSLNGERDTPSTCRPGWCSSSNKPGGASQRLCTIDRLWTTSRVCR